MLCATYKEKNLQNILWIFFPKCISIDVQVVQTCKEKKCIPHEIKLPTANFLWEAYIFLCKFVCLFYLCFRWKTPMKPFASTMKPCTIFAFVLWNLPTLLMEIWTIWFRWPCQVKFFFEEDHKKLRKFWQIFVVLLEITNFMIALWFIVNDII